MKEQTKQKLRTIGRLGIVVVGNFVIGTVAIILAKLIVKYIVLVWDLVP